MKAILSTNFPASESLAPRIDNPGNGKIILGKEELVVDKKKKISSLELEEDKILPQEGRRGFS